MTYFMDPINPKKPSTHRVLMNFMLRNGWQISFLEEDCKTSLRRRLVFRDPGKIIEMARRWGEKKTSTAIQKIEDDIRIGRPGGVWLVISEEQYRKLLR
jgi:hypothetical protein